MNRINCIPPQQLRNVDLIKEYKSIGALYGILCTSPPKCIPSNYDGGDNLEFFCDKLNFVSNRLDTIYAVMKSRGVTMDWNLYLLLKNGIKKLTEESASDNLISHWQPTPKDFYTNMEELVNN